MAWRSLSAKGMGVSVGLLVDCTWNGGSDLQAGVEIYYFFFFGMAVSRPKCINKLSSVLGGWQ